HQRSGRIGRPSRSIGLLLALGIILGLAAFGALTITSASAQAVETRHYYIAADEVAWDYAPSGINQITGEPFGEEENVFVAGGRDRIGRVYLKALYREYTSESFAFPSSRSGLSTSSLQPGAGRWKSGAQRRIGFHTAAKNETRP
ncbi:MAG TPA: hypothetical protein VJ645_01980, partial [Gaiellaceae bacterium]|nr:hypothetical protein [Gaiellaceae bacterium]